MHEARRKARAAAERRKVLTAGSGQKLGGAPVLRGTDIRRVIANAAQRRIDIEKGCASGTDKGRQIAEDVEVKNQGTTTTKAEDDDENERVIMQAYIDLIHEEEAEKYGQGYVPPSESNPAGSRASSSPPGHTHPLLADQANMEQIIKQAPQPPAVPTATKPPSVKTEPKPAATPPINLTATPDLPPDTWTCDICTLVNPIQFLTCDACATERPSKFTDTPRPTTHPSRPSSAGSTRRSNHDREMPNALKPRLNVVESIARLREQEASKPDKPMGWTCSRCGNWMEQQWWTCSACGNMKDSS